MNIRNTKADGGRRLPVPAKELQCVINYATFRLDRYGETSEKKLRDALKNKTANQDWVHQAIARMLELGYLCDLRYAQMLVRNGVELKRWGKHRIEQTLREKGITRDIAEQAMQAIEDDDQLTRAVSCLSKKFTTKIEYRDQKVHARAVRHLVNRGYGFDVISEAIKTYNDSIVEDIMITR